MLLLCCLTLLAANARALYPSRGNVIELNPSNFNSLVVGSDEIWIVEFFAPWCGHCQSLVPEYTKAANALKGIVKVGAVNADKNKELSGRYEIGGFPTIKMFGANKKKPEDYQGARTAEAIVNAGLRAAKAKAKAALDGDRGSSRSARSSDDVIQLTDTNFDELVLQSDDMWLVEFFAPWCGHCKNLAPHWAKAASELKGNVKLGALDATVNTAKASQYQIQGYPTIKLFGRGPKTAFSAEDYDGGRTSSEIVQWALDKLAESAVAPEVTQIISQELFKEQCVQKPLCVISVLPHILDCQSKCRNNYIKMITEMGEKFKKKMWGWVWAEAGAQPELENAFDIGGFGYPAMAVINAKKMKYSILRGSFSKDGIREFLRDLSYGKGNTALVKGQVVPKIISLSPWDRKDGELPTEDDIDLSDLDLNNLNEL